MLSYFIVGVFFFHFCLNNKKGNGKFIPRFNVRELFGKINNNIYVNAMVNVTTLVRYIFLWKFICVLSFSFSFTVFLRNKKEIRKIHKRNEIEYTFENINIRYDTHDYEIYIGYVAVYIRTVLHFF